MEENNNKAFNANIIITERNRARATKGMLVGLLYSLYFMTRICFFLLKLVRLLGVIDFDEKPQNNPSLASQFPFFKQWQ